jgi:hypothetical protein
MKYVCLKDIEKSREPGAIVRVSALGMKLLKKGFTMDALVSREKGGDKVPDDVRTKLTVLDLAASLVKAVQYADNTVQLKALNATYEKCYELILKKKGGDTSSGAQSK